MTQNDFRTTISQDYYPEKGTVRMKRALLKIVSCLMAVVFPLAMFAADQPAAMLYSVDGGA